MIRLEDQHWGQRSVDVGIVPMINIVFLLLLYFLVAGRLTDDQGPAVQLPLGGGAKSPLPAAVVLHVSAAGQISADGQPLSDTALTQRLASLEGTGHGSVLVRADANASAAALHRIMAAGRAASLTSFELATLEAN